MPAQKVYTPALPPNPERVERFTTHGQRMLTVMMVEARKQAGLSQGQAVELMAANGCPIRKDSLSRKEAGDRRFTLDDLFHLAAIYGKPVSWFFSAVGHPAAVEDVAA